MNGSVLASLDASLRRAAAYLGVGWQALVIWVVLVTEPTQPRWRLVAAHVALGLITLLIIRGRRYLGVAAAAFYLMWWYDYYASPGIDSPLFLAACWSANMTNLLVALLGRRRITAVLPLAAALGCGLALDATSPIGSMQLTSTLVVTAGAIAAVGALAMSRLWGIAEDADGAAERAQEELQAAALASAVAREAADDARILHDTVINTLAAVAIGGAAVDDETLVRERCRHDLVAIGSLVDERVVTAPQSLSQIGSGPGDRYPDMDVRRTGLGDQDIRALEAELPEAVSRALNAATRELVRNSAKHAGVGEVNVDVSRSATEVAVEVSDEGRGFDGVPVPGRGFDKSVLARMADVGGQVRIESAPGQGTRVRITCATAATDVRDDDAEETLPDPKVLADRIRARACWLWSVGLVLVGVVIEIGNRPGVLSPTYAMLALVAIVTALAWGVTRRRQGAPGWLLAVLFVCVPIAFLAGMAGAGFGHGDVFHYQAWGLTPLLVMLLTLGRGARHFMTGLVLLVITAVVAAVVVGRDSQSAGAVVVVGAAPAIGLLMAWLEFYRLIGRILWRANDDRRAALRLRLETTARSAANAVRARWRAAELDTMLRLLEDLASGELSPTDAAVRARCGAEEAYLRQLTQLSPDAFRMGEPFTRALASARLRGVDLAVRTGSVDAPDDAAARVLGRVVLDAVAAVPDGSAVTIGLFQGAHGPQLTIVAPGLGDRLESWRLDRSIWSTEHHLLGAQEMIEICWRQTPAIA